MSGSCSDIWRRASRSEPAVATVNPSFAISIDPQYELFHKNRQLMHETVERLARLVDQDPSKFEDQIEREKKTTYKPVRLVRNADSLMVARVAELQWDLGGLAYEMAIRDHFRPDVLARRAAELRTLCGMAPAPQNRLTFHSDRLDEFGLPRVSGEIALSPEDREHLRACESAHAELARAIEDPLHPTHARVKDQLPRGAPHLCGSHRMGDRPDGTTVTDPFGRVWAYENLYLAGNGMLPGSSSCNPALTVVAVALRTADAIIAAYD